MYCFARAKCCPKTIVECELQVMTGDVRTLTVHLDWDVAALKEQIEYELGYSSWLQVLSNDHKKLEDRDRLRDVYAAQCGDDFPLQLFLTFLHVPGQLEEGEVRRVWEAFRIHSADHGDTVTRESVDGVMRYLALHYSDCQVNDLTVDRERISFVELLSIANTIKDTSAAKAAEDLVEDRFCFAGLEAVDDLYVVSGQFIRPRRNWSECADCFPLSRGGRSGSLSGEAFVHEDKSASSLLPQSPIVRERVAAKTLLHL
eukprot:TRINITY_DN3820_c0_g2_i1.p1 TRINITY_DN3820_c0_g2~~TRINITY_DN3820_c0_g2_i1.p1  ORF type:complete len:258 (-),score=30.73 TRINITY_DN3820_c0_g2_i1:144-917(-)